MVDTVHRGGGGRGGRRGRMLIWLGYSPSCWGGTVAVVRRVWSYCSNERVVSSGYTTSHPASSDSSFSKALPAKDPEPSKCWLPLVLCAAAYAVSVAVIQKLPNKVYSVGLALSTLWSQLSLLPVPCSKEQIQTDDYGLCQCCKALTEFMRPFVEEATDNKENKENEKLKEELLKL